jgi:hypothetical protein
LYPIEVLSAQFQFSLSAATLCIYLGGEDPLLLHGAGSGCLPSLELIPIRHSMERGEEKGVCTNKEDPAAKHKGRLLHIPFQGVAGLCGS